MSAKRIGLLVVIAAAIAAFFLFDLDRFLTLEALKQGQARFLELRGQHPWLVTLAYFAIYVLVTGLSLPGAAVLTLAAGALFGLLWGVLVVSFASSAGATLAFLASRYLFRQTVQRRFSGRLEAINSGIERDGAFYLFTLRLVPVFPFFLINLLMGLTPIRTWTFYWVSQLGMLPGTAVYVNAGTQLASIESLGEILSPRVLLSLALLGLFPLVARIVVRRLRRRQVNAQWQRPRHFDRNLVVIGAGAAGLVASYVAASVRAKVTLVEAHKMGGDCLNFGCVPSKTLIKSSRVAHRMTHADRYGLKPVTEVVDFRAVMDRVENAIRKIEPHDSVERYTRLGVEVLKGDAHLLDPWTVEISLNDGGTCRLTTRAVVLATGSRPQVPPIPGLEDVGYLTTDTLWQALAELDRPPPRLVVLGGGPIGCELAQALARLGSSVTIIEQAARLLTREDEEVSQVAQDALARDGVDVLTGSKAVRCEQNGARTRITVASNGSESSVECDVLLCAVGRQARLDGYGLDELGIAADKTIETDSYLQTLCPNVYAAGDVAGPYQFTHVAGHQGWYAAVNGLFGHIKRFKVDYSAIPRVTFMDPEIAQVGVNELEARERGIEHEVTRYGIDELDRAITESADRGFVKVLTEPGKDRILGVTIVGEHAGEILAEFTLAMQHGLGLKKILGTVHAYPTFAEANKYAAGEWRRAHVPEWLFTWLERYHAWRRS